MDVNVLGQVALEDLDRSALALYVRGYHPQKDATAREMLRQDRSNPEIISSFTAACSDFSS